MRRLWRALVRHEPRWVVIVFAALFVVGSVRFFAARRVPSGVPEIRIGADGRYHWAFLTSLVLDHDLDFANQYANPDSGNYYEYSRTATGRYANPFPVGAAVLWAPFFVVAHGVSRLVEPAHSADGTSYLHQRITLYSSFLFAFAAGLLVYAMARRRYGPGASLAGAVVALVCGPLLQYALHQPAYAHAPSAFTVALLLFMWDRGRSERQLRGWLVLGALVGLAMLVRAQNLVFAAPAVAEGGWRIWRALRRGGLVAAARAAVAPLLGAVIALALFAPQLVVWKVLYGHFFAIPQGPGYMRWTRPLWAETLFSSRNGLFPYAPLWALGLLGLVPVARREPKLGAALVATLVLAAYVNGASSDWSGGGAFGGRRYDGLLLHVALGFAALAYAVGRLVERHPRRVAAALVAGVVALGVTQNAMLADDYRRGRLPPSSTKDTLALYDGVWMRVARAVGNPLSWPAEWAFALATGAPPSRYDEVVGAFFLTDFRLEEYRKPANKAHDELRFAAAGSEKFLVSGFGETRADGKIQRRAVAPRARFLVPLNHAGGVRMELVGVGTRPGTVGVLWNGAVVARAELAPNTPVRVPFALSSRDVRRGINVVELVHDGPDAAAYEKLEMWETP